MDHPQIPEAELERRKQAHLAPRATVLRGVPPRPESWKAPEVKLAGRSERIKEIDDYLVTTIQDFAWRLETGVQDDSSFSLGLSYAWYPASQSLVEPFGGEPIPDTTDPAHWWAKPAVSSPTEALKLREPKELGKHVTRALDLIMYIRESVEDAYPVGGPVLTSPFDTASYVMGFQPLLEAVYEYPKAVHHVCELVTNFLVKLIPLIYQAANSSPDREDFSKIGAFLCSETRAVVSDEVLAEFETPYLKRIRDEFGSLAIHSCGNWVHHMPRLVKEGYADSVDFGHPECDFRKAAKILNGKVSVYPTTNVASSDYQLPPEVWYDQVLSAVTDDMKVTIDVPYDNTEAFNLVWKKLETESKLALPLRNVGLLPPITVPS